MAKKSKSKVKVDLEETVTEEVKVELEETVTEEVKVDLEETTVKPTGKVRRKRAIRSER